MKIVISIHVPKTGGTSFRRMLENFYGEGFRPDYDWEPLPDVLSGKVISATDKEICESLVGISCIHGHFNVKKYMRLLDVDGIEPTFITWVRDPIERAVSTYYFLRTLGTPPASQAEWERKANALTLEEFYTQTDFGQNEQYAQLRALPLEQMSFWGCTERYDESMRLFAKKYFPDQDLPIIPHELKNTSRGEGGYIIEENIRHRLMLGNEEDAKLYKYAVSWLDEELSK